MAGVFLDTSAFAKLFIEEQGSVEVGRIVREAEAIRVCSIVLPETLSAARRLVSEGKLEAADYDRIKESACNDIAAIEVVAVSDEVIARAIDAIERSQIRTLDALHIGAAISVEASRFVTSDSRQAAAARDAGLEVILVR